MAAETHPSSSSSSDNYDVFLSFRGTDTRQNFTDHLYNALIQAGIRTFIDSEELHHGEEIGPKLLKSIEQSRISIPIFSKNYASSKWCLRELTKIMEFKKTCGQIVWPIFYKVEPCHVRNQTGCFEEAFLEHKKEQCEEEVRAWRHALTEAGNLIGWDSKAPKYSLESSDLIKSVVDKALTEVIQITTLHVAKHPIGIESRVEEVMRMLDVESQDVLFVGIHGMGGIGKTTTARAIFNKISKQFESKRFLEDVKERASQVQGLLKLQNDLASDLLKEEKQRIDNVASGINVIKKLFCNKKVLIVLDDVDHNKQLESLAGGCDWFGSGSRIIITTRDENILKVNKVDKSKIYKPNELDGDLSLQLFSKYAFESDQPPQDLKDLSKGIVSVLGGLPLAIEVVGSFLCDEKEHMVWEDTLNTLRESPDAEVYEKLKISYDGLNHPFLKKLFLDIACFFIGMDIESVIPAWQACGYNPRQRIMVLVHKSLVKIDNDNKLRVHDQLRDMGREIVRQENLNNPGERSRLWSHKEALEVLKENKGTRNVEGLFLDFGYEAKNHSIDFDYKAFKVMSDLRLLQVDHVGHHGNNLGHLPQGLKWLSLKGISSKCVPTISHMEKLAVLDLSGSMITDGWNGWKQIQLISTLKVLDLSSCYMLKRTPHFSCNSSLERLILDRCRSLVAFHKSIGHLQKLVLLSLDSCEKLTELPNSISDLSLLQQLDLVACKTLKLLPEMPPGLIKLNISGCTSMERLPNLSTLKNLKELRLDECKELAEIKGIDGLTLLQELDLSDCSSIQRLPNLSTLKNLKELRLDKCKELAEIEGIAGLTLVQELDLSDCYKLQSLSELPSSLIKLNATYCKSIQRLPNLSNLKNLRELLLCRCEKLSEIQGIRGLSLLQQLDLSSCTTLHSLPELPPSLIRLDVRFCFSLETLPNLSTMKHLKELSLVDCYKLAEIEDDMDEHSLLQELDLSYCRELQSLPELPSSLIKLNASYCGSIETLPNLSNLKSLRVLYLCCSNLSEIQGISGLSLLWDLQLKDCKMLRYLPGLPSSLIKLVIEGCMSMERIPNLSSLRSLKDLHLDNCKNLANIQGINDLTLLQELYLGRCSKLQSLSELPSSLTRIHVHDCENLFEIQGISDLSLLQTLHLRSCRELHSLDLSNLRILESLSLEGCDNLAEIRGLESLESLIDLQAFRCYTYVKTLPKSVAEGRLPTAFNEGKICHNWLMIPDDDNIKGTIFYLVYQVLQDRASFWPSLRDIFSIEVEIKRNDGKRTITCFHDLRVEGMKANTDEDQFYSCYFQGLTWFGFPLKKSDMIILVRTDFKTSGVQLKMLDLVMEYEAMEDRQQLEKRVVPLITSTTIIRKAPCTSHHFYN